ncbi:MAG TPA: hypothetical protein VG759_00650 [Candidatus Angelobacter sp.]|nr:hypothetical protein [Candidatus Angelobacter sp.]
MKYQFPRFLTTSAVLLLLFGLACNRPTEISIERLGNPAPHGSIAPNVTEGADSQAMLSWIEPANNTLALRFSFRDANGWSVPQTIVERPNFARYPESPSWVLMLPNGALISTWSEELPSEQKWPGSYLYAAVSADKGKSWSRPVVVHSDRSNSEHSFASLAALDENHADIVWLDARDNESKHKYRLMSAVISSAGSVANEETIDDDVCTCCPTALAQTGAGLLAAYRDHTPEQLRDIYSIRRESGRWQTSKPIHQDGWRINACPVNGPALASRGNNVAVAWFTGAQDKPIVRVAFSNDGGATFQGPAIVDSADQKHSPMGRVSIALLASGDALVAWTLHRGDHSELVATRVNRNSGVTDPTVIATSGEEGLGYPHMQPWASGALLAWGGAGEEKEIKTAILRPGNAR